ncbi:hypothetical protein Shell_0847 [Staphylothermus hellenicus DSM 12710]|uniref:Uncharacterized protein n=1 Tax=Staphylothermus hellenicus (strain DSM 12710 / JCM 10830 / BK20S6-10-b1 / P8) TaxID=591019 RepID=D7D863_STAHD|nr:hypothetical protein Shell_0847 [Staphylothermus hellenicus DSM 12710]
MAGKSDKPLLETLVTRRLRSRGIMEVVVDI